MLTPTLALSAAMLAGAPAPASSSIELSPAFTSFGVAVYGNGNLWVSKRDRIWRYGSRGTGEEIRVPDAAGIRAVYPRGGTADILIPREVLRLAGSSFSRVVSFDPPVQIAVPVRGGYVAIGLVGGLMYWEGELGTELHFSVLGEDGVADQPLDVEFSPRGGALISVDEERFAYVLDSPYRIVLMTMDGTARVIDVDESSYRRTLAAKKLDEPFDPYSPKRISRASRTRFGFASDDGSKLVLDRHLRHSLTWDEMPEAIRARLKGEPPEGKITVPETYYDAINLETGLVERRVRMWELGGRLVGLRDESLAVLVSEGERSFLKFISWENVPLVEQSSGDVGELRPAEDLDALAEALQCIPSGD